jgi:hypothetical protein
VLARVERDYVKECQAFLSARGERTWSEVEARSKVAITVRDNRSVRTIPLPDPGGVVRIVSR